jgi:hypothetical protein
LNCLSGNQTEPENSLPLVSFVKKENKAFLILIFLAFVVKIVRANSLDFLGIVFLEINLSQKILVRF